MSSSGSEDEVDVRVSKARKAAPVPQRKRKAPKPKKDPTKPKRGLSPYFCFMREERPGLVAHQPGLKIGEVTKVLAARWNKLGAGDKQKFIKLADEDKDRYLEEMKVWEAAQRGVTLKPAKPKAAPVPAKKAKKPVEEEEDEEDEEEEDDEEEEEEESE